MDGLTKRELAFLRHSALLNERSAWDGRWRTLSEHMLPFSGRFVTTDRNRGDNSFHSIYDSTGTRALRILGAGMQAGVTSPARPWFRLATTDLDLMEFTPVKLWLSDVTDLIREVFNRCNLYRCLHATYEELGAFGTAAMVVEDDFDSVIWNHSLTVGEYAVATNSRGKVDTIFREFDMTVANLVEKFGINNVSAEVKRLYEEGKLFDQWRTVLHVIQPRALSERDTRKRDAKNMAYSSCYYEKGDQLDKGKALRESGYKNFRALVPRWHTRGGDIYGNCPGMEALGDVMQLQHEQYRKAQGIDYQTLPPVQLPLSAKGKSVDTLPGGATYIDMTGQNASIKPAFEVRLDLQHLLADIQDVRQRINQTFYADLFLMLSNDQRRQPVTAREIAERHEEKLLMLGPVLERLHDELLNPLIDIAFTRVMEAGIMPPPPKEMQGMELNVEFVSTLAQAQRMVGIGAFDRLLGTVVSVAPVRPEILDKIDTDQIIDRMADMLGVDPSVIVADEKVALIRKDRAEAQAKVQQAAMIPAGAAAARDLAAADTESKNALTDMMNGLQGYTTEGVLP